MAKYEITYKCGHTGTINLCGKVADRARRVEWLEANEVCPDCYKAAQATKHAQEAAQAAEKADKMALPELTGSEKQIVWAMSIRQTEIAKVEKFLNSENLEVSYYANYFIENVVSKIVSAGEWINNRNSSIWAKYMADLNDSFYAR